MWRFSAGAHRGRSAELGPQFARRWAPGGGGVDRRRRDAAVEVGQECRQPRIGGLDDATGTALALRFRPTEDLHGYTLLLGHLATTYGLPVAFVTLSLS